MNAIRLAMWSGPRNISTAMMRAFENRSDCVVSDEPLYAAFLTETGLDHPGATEVMADGECDWQKVASQLLGPIPEGKSLWYQKHMSHHLLPHMDRAWIHGLNNAFLIRHPNAVVASYIKSRAEVVAEDIGLLQEAELFNEIHSRSGKMPPVIDSAEFLGNPRGFLNALCAHFGFAFEERMLQWPAGPRSSDGIWAKYWYDAVWQSTGFEARPERIPTLSAHHQSIADACMPAYEHLYAARLKPLA